MTKTEPTIAAEDLALAAALSEPPRRIRPLDLPDGRRVWLKRVEQVRGRMRLQKGDGRAAFMAEREALRLLRAEGAPVPEVLAEGPDYLLLPDLGPNMAAVLRDHAVGQAERIAALSAAGGALAGLHRAGYAHGRPALRDFCWKDGELRLIDLERFRARRRSRTVRALDLVIFAHGWFANDPAASQEAELDAAMMAYRRAAPAEIWPVLARLVRLMSPLGVLARLVLRLRSEPSQDVRAVPPALAYLRRVTEAAG